MTGTHKTSPVRLLGRYELLVPIARGGMGQVWAARLHGGRGFQKLVAVKTILPQAGDVPAIEYMMQEEARLAARIHHPNVVHTIDLGEDDGTLYLVMEWVDGEPLHKVMKRAYERERFPLEVSVNLIAQTCRGLHAAHDVRDEDGKHLGLVHRDVSPHNILITHSGLAKLFDFGIAKAMNQPAFRTEQGEIKGKFSYMAPEQLLGKAVDCRADIFALGIVLYWLTVGQHPFKDENPGETVLGITGDQPAPPPTRFVPDYPRALEEVVLKALAKSPADRFKSAEEMCVALQRALPGAFAIGIDVEIKNYLRRIIGDRAVQRRALLRHSIDAVDDWRKANGEQLGGGASSAGSLRAIVIDSALRDDSIPEIAVPRVATEPSSPVPGRSRSSKRFVKALLLAASLATVLGVGFGLRSLPRHQAPVLGASIAPEPTLAPEHLPTPPTPSDRTAKASERETSQAPALLATTPTAAASAAPPIRVVRGKSRGPVKAAAKPVTRDGRDVGLLPPDYAGTP